MPRYGEKATCYCGREIRWTGKWWEHTEGVFRHVAEPSGLTPVAADAEQQQAAGDDEPRAAEHWQLGGKARKEKL